MSEIAEADDSAAQNPQFAGSVKPRLAAVPVSRPTAASAHHVEQTPELHDLAADDPVEDATWHLNTLASGRDALQFTSVRAPTGPPLGHLVPFRDQLLNAGMPAGKFSPKRTNKILYPI